MGTSRALRGLWICLAVGRRALRRSFRRDRSGGSHQVGLVDWLRRRGERITQAAGAGVAVIPGRVTYWRIAPFISTLVVTRSW